MSDEDDDAPAVPSDTFLSHISTFSAPRAAAKRSASDVTSSPSPSKRIKLSPSSSVPIASTSQLEPSVKVKKPLKEGQGRYKKGVKKSYKLYPELLPLPEKLQSGLDILWIGINPGKCSAQKGHSFANPTNRFWTYLHKSGCTDTKLSPEADVLLAETHNMSISNFIARPTTAEAELSKEEWKEAVPLFLQKMEVYRPKIIALLGVKVFTSLRDGLLPSKARKANPATSSVHFPPSTPTIPSIQRGEKVQMGFQKMKLIYALRSDKVDDGADSALLQDEGLPESKQSPIEKETTRGEETYIFALPSPSGLETHYQGEPAIALFRQVKEFSDRLKSGRTIPEDINLVQVNVSAFLRQVQEG